MPKKRLEIQNESCYYKIVPRGTDKVNSGTDKFLNTYVFLFTSLRNRKSSIVFFGMV